MFGKFLNKKSKHHKRHIGAKRYIADMETDGVYFPQEVKNKLEQKRQELICNYSDLPSVMSYLEDDEYYNEQY